MKLLEELQQRRVIRVAIAYAVASWVVIQVFDIATGSFSAPDWVMQVVLVAAVLGFFAALALAWSFRWTPRGMQRNRDRAAAISDRGFQLGEWLIRPDLLEIQRDHQKIRLKPKSMDVLRRLADARGQVVSRDELFDSVWPGGVVSDDTLTQCIVELRKAFGDSAKTPSFIETIPRKGFRLLVPPDAVTDTPERAARSSQGNTWFAAFVFAGVAAAGALFWMRTEPHDSASTGDKTLAVLPFTDMSPGQDQEYFADGLTEELINKLAGFDGLLVTGRTSSFVFKGRNEDLRSIGDILNVEYILEGSLRRAGNQLRITAQLIEVASGFPLWSDSLDREASDLFALQDELSHAVASALAVRLRVGGDLNPHNTTSVEAWRLWNQAVNGKDKEDPLRSIELLRQALEIDPDYALAWAQLSHIHLQFERAAAPDWREKSVEYFRRAWQLDPDSLPILERAVFHHIKFGRWVEAERALAAIDEYYNHALGTGPHLEFLTKMGRSQDAIELAERGLRRDPLAFVYQLFAQHAYAMAGRPDEADALAEKMYEQSGQAGEGLHNAFSNPDPAIFEKWTGRFRDSDSDDVNSVMADLYPDREAALEWLRSLPPERETFFPQAWAAYLGDTQLALELMQRAPDAWAFWMPHNAPVRNTPGFKDVVREMGLETYFREYGWNDYCRPLDEHDFECQ